MSNLPFITPAQAQMINVKDYGAKGDGTTDDTAAFQAALNDPYNGPYGRELFIPHGAYLITDSIIPDMDHHNGLTIRGAGPFSTFIKFVPTAHDKICFNIYNTIAEQRVRRVSIRDLTINADVEETYRKTAIYVEDNSALSIVNVDIRGFHDPSYSSVGVRVNGREGAYFRLLVVNYADRPFVCGTNPHYEMIGNDNFVFIQCAFVCETGGSGLKAFEVESNSPMFNSTFYGCNFILGDYGFYYADSASSYGTSIFRFNHSRREQAESSTGYSVYIDADPAKQNWNVTFNDFQFDTTQNGLYVRNLDSVVLNNCNHSASSSVVLNIDAVNAMSLTGFNTLGAWTPSTQSASLGNLKLIKSSPQIHSGCVVPHTAEYISIEDWNITDDGAVGENVYRRTIGRTIIAPQQSSDLTFSASGKTITTAGAMDFTGIKKNDIIYTNTTNNVNKLFTVAADATSTVITVSETVVDETNPADANIIHAIKLLGYKANCQLIHTTVSAYCSNEGATADKEQRVEVTVGAVGNASNASVTNAAVFNVVNVSSAAAPTADLITLTATTSPARLWNNRTTYTYDVVVLVEHTYILT